MHSSALRHVVPSMPRVGVCVGAFVGALVGRFVGALVGRFVGALVGRFVGALVGTFVLSRGNNIVHIYDSRQ